MLVARTLPHAYYIQHFNRIIKMSKNDKATKLFTRALLDGEELSTSTAFMSSERNSLSYRGVK